MFIFSLSLQPTFKELTNLIERSALYRLLLSKRPQLYLEKVPVRLGKTPQSTFKVKNKGHLNLDFYKPATQGGKHAPHHNPKTQFLQSYLHQKGLEAKSTTAPQCPGLSTSEKLSKFLFPLA